MTPTEFNVAMARLGLRNKDLAADTGLSPDYISLRKRGKAPISRLLQRYLELRLALVELEAIVPKQIIDELLTLPGVRGS